MREELLVQSEPKSETHRTHRMGPKNSYIFLGKKYPQWIFKNLTMCVCVCVCVCVCCKVWTIYKVYIEFVTILLRFYILDFWP